MTTSDDANGAYVLTLWANAGGVDAASVRSNFRSKYGDTGVSNLGKSARGVNFASLSNNFVDRIDAGASTTEPTPKDLGSALLEVGGESEGILSFLGTGAISVSTSLVENTVDLAGAAKDGLVGILKYLPYILIIGGVAYIAWNTGILKNVIKK